MSRRGTRRRGMAIGALTLAAATLPAIVERPWWVIAGGLSLCLVASAIAVEDMARMLIPDGLTAAMAAIGIVLFALSGGNVIGFAFLTAYALLTAATLFAVSLVYARLRDREGIGFGDVKLVGASALLVGPWGVAMQILLASTAAILFVVIRAIRRRRPLRSVARVPFGAFLAPALVIVWAWLGPLP